MVQWSALDIEKLRLSWPDPHGQMSFFRWSKTKLAMAMLGPRAKVMKVRRNARLHRFMAMFFARCWMGTTRV